MLELHDQGLTYLAIAAHTGWPQRAVFAVLERSETLAPVATQRTDFLTPVQAERVRALRRRGVPVARLHLPPELHRLRVVSPLTETLQRRIEALRRRELSYSKIAHRLRGVTLDGAVRLAS